MIAAELEAVLADHLPALAAAHVRVRLDDGGAVHPPRGHHHAPDPVPVRGSLAEGVVGHRRYPGGRTHLVHGPALCRPGRAAQVLMGNSITLRRRACPADEP